MEALLELERQDLGQVAVRAPTVAPAALGVPVRPRLFNKTHPTVAQRGAGPSSADAVAPAIPAQRPQASPQRKFRRCYSVNFSATSMADAKKPSDFSRVQFATLVATRHAEVFAETVTEGVSQNSVVKTMCFQERHADGSQHKYLCILCDRPYACELVRTRLRTVDKVHITFGTDHVFFWSTVVYGGLPTVHKAKEELDAAPYHSEGKTLREELADMPRGARAADKDRVREYLGLPGGGGKKNGHSM